MVKIRKNFKMDSFIKTFLGLFIATLCVWSVESTQLDSSAGLKYYIIFGAVFGIFLAIVVISLFVLCWCCRLQKPKEDLTQLKQLVSRDSTTPKHQIITGMAPRRDFLQRDDDPLPYKKKPRLLNREESTL